LSNQTLTDLFDVAGSSAQGLVFWLYVTNRLLLHRSIARDGVVSIRTFIVGETQILAEFYLDKLFGVDRAPHSLGSILVDARPSIVVHYRPSRRSVARIKLANF